MYTTSTEPSFFYNEYKVAIVVDFSQLKHNLDFGDCNQASPMVYFKTVRQTLRVILKNLYFKLKNSVFSELQT